MIDTHAHLDACSDPAGELIARARAAGVERVVAIGSGIDSSRVALELSRREPGVFVAAGVLPHQAATGEADRLDELRELLADERIVAVGETGLDFYRDYAPRERQLQLFEAQLALAAEFAKPVVVHTRAADADTVAVLDGFTGTVVMHCFSAPSLLAAVLERGYYVSFAGNVTYKSASELRAAARAVPAERILAETDCPYLAPQRYRGRENEPAYVVDTVAELAAARGTPSAELGAQIDANASAAFSL